MKTSGCFRTDKLGLYLRHLLILSLCLYYIVIFSIGIIWNVHADSVHVIVTLLRLTVYYRLSYRLNTANGCFRCDKHYTTYCRQNSFFLNGYISCFRCDTDYTTRCRQKGLQNTWHISHAVARDPLSFLRKMFVL